MFGEIEIAISAVVIAFIVGAVAGRDWSRGEEMAPLQPSKECKELCLQLRSKKNDRIQAEKDEASARDKVNSLIGQLAIAAAIAAGLWAAAGASFSSVIGILTGSAATLLAAAVVASAIAALVAGLLFSANFEYRAKEKEARRARKAEDEAGKLLIEGCDDEEFVESCLGRNLPDNSISIIYESSKNPLRSSR